jgi:hypothetical protein
MSGDEFAYWIARSLVALLGLFFLLMSMVVVPLVSPSTDLSMTALAFGLPLAALMLVPNRWTVVGPRYHWRMAVSLFVGTFFALGALGEIPQALDGQHDPTMMPFICFTGFSGLCLPGCLWWRARMARSKMKPFFTSDDEL